MQHPDRHGVHNRKGQTKGSGNGEGEFYLVAVVVKDEVGRYAEKAGLYVLTQTDEGGAALLNREGFKPRTFE